MPEQSYTPKKYQDFISDFTAGMDSGISPLLLEKNQIGIGVNCSLREGFVHSRPPLMKRILAFNGNTALQNLIITGLFQGAGYYRPDSGTELLLASVSGHLLQFQESTIGGSWNVTDVSVPGSLNSATQSQSWMWQAEKWMIVNDGTTSLPIFFNGTSSRRSYGPTQVVGEVASAVPSTPPPIYVSSAVPPLNGNATNTTNVQSQAAVLVTLNSPYTGQFNVPVIFNGEYYMAVQSAIGFEVTLTNVTDVPGNTIEVGETVVIQTQTTTTQTATVAQPATVSVTNRGQPDPYGIGTVTVVFTQPVTLVTSTPAQYGGGSATYYTFNGLFDGTVWIATSGSGTTWTFYEEDSAQVANGAPIPAGTTMGLGSSTSTVVTPIGNIAQNFIVPPAGKTVNVFLTQPYTGASGQMVFINNGQYSIAPYNSGGAITELTLINLSDTSTAAYTGFALPINTVPELPAGRMGCYGMGRNWFSLTNGLSYEAGDIVGGGSGTPAYSYRDAVLKTTENDFLTNGGTFSLPGSGDIITAMIFPPVLDTSLGVGSLQIFTPFSVFANNAPADRTTWANLTWPIQTESLKDQGALSQNSTTLVNSDCFFRGDFNFGSLVLARRQFQLNQWGNKPISDELLRILELDNQSLLRFGSAVSFDNRFLATCSPQPGAQGVYNQGLVSLNFDPLSSLRTSDPPVWEGAWSGINILQVVVGRVNGTRRCFAFTYNILTAQIELYELLAESTSIQQGIYQDNNTTPITWMFETPVMFNQDVHPLSELLQLRDGEIYLSEISGPVTINVYWRPDFYPCWTLWNTLSVCANVTGPNSEPSYRMRLGLGEPSVQPTEIGNNRPLRVGYFFQFRFVITGSCTFNGMRASAALFPDPVFAPVKISSTCDTIDCTTTPDLAIYSLQSPPYTPPVTPPTPAPAVCTFLNQLVTFSFTNFCPEGFPPSPMIASLPPILLPPPSFNGLPPFITTNIGPSPKYQLFSMSVIAGTFCGSTQAAANQLANTILTNFIGYLYNQSIIKCVSP